MSTNIKSTNLDFESIKKNLKNFLKTDDQFKDYNFSASALNNLLDVLAWNTHYNALTANFSLNEAYLNTAQLRSSVVSIAENLGYIPKSKTSATAVVNLNTVFSGVANKPLTISLPANYQFNAIDENITYVFQTKDSLIGRLTDENGTYEFENSITGTKDITIYEGRRKIKSFLVDEGEENAIYVIPDKNLDINSAIVKVFPTESTSSFVTYQNIKDVSVLTDESAIYILKESPNGYFELTFGGGTTLGKSPAPGYRIELSYLSTVGVDANGIQSFVAPAPYVYNGESFNINVITVSESSGGENIENIESIRKHAPFQYASQNRAVTAVDYQSLILRKFNSYIRDIKCYGGEDAARPKFGYIFVSLITDGLDVFEVDRLKSDIISFIKDYSVVSFDIEFIEPVETFIDCAVIYDFNPKFTTLSVNQINTSVEAVVNKYFSENTGKFGQSFRRSQLLSLVDEVSPAVLSSRAEVKLQQRFKPTFDKKMDYKLTFPVNLSKQDDDTYTITSSQFIANNTVCYIRNRLSTNILEVVRSEDGTILVDNVGEYSPIAGLVTITGLNIQSLFAGDTLLKITAVPANQSSISPMRENYIVQGRTFGQAIIVSTT